MCMNNNDQARDIVKKIHAVVFSIMCDIDDFCRENDITYFTYFLSGGTCLGAVRHKGFIPWDDDADIMMPRPDYERFLELYPKYCEGKYYVGSLKNAPNWQRPFARISDVNSTVRSTLYTDEDMGIWVDLFAIDGLPRGKASQYIHYRRTRILTALRNTSVRTKFKEDEGLRVIKNAAVLITRRLGARYFAERMDRLSKKNAFNESDEVGAVLACHYWNRETIEKGCMDKAIEFSFEGRSFPVPIGWDKYLSNLYGDYMVIPKDVEEKGYTHLDSRVVEFL